MAGELLGSLQRLEWLEWRWCLERCLERGPTGRVVQRLRQCSHLTSGVELRRHPCLVNGSRDCQRAHSSAGTCPHGQVLGAVRDGLHVHGLVPVPSCMLQVRYCSSLGRFCRPHFCKIQVTLCVTATCREWTCFLPLQVPVVLHLEWLCIHVERHRGSMRPPP